MEEQGQTIRAMVNGELRSSFLPAAYCLPPTANCLLPTAFEEVGWREAPLIPPS